MLNMRDDPSFTSSKKKKGMRWPFGKKKKKMDAAIPTSAGRGRSPMRSGGTVSTSTSRQQNGLNNSNHSQNQNQYANTSRQIRRGYDADRSSLPPRFRSPSTPTHPHSPKVSYIVPMKDGGIGRDHLSQPSLDTSRPPLRGTALLCNTNYFKSLCDGAFDDIDQDRSGSVDEKELYSGLLLIHLKLGMYLGPAACRPLERPRCHAIFERMDVDDSGCLDREEFRHVMMFLFGNVLLRVMVQWSMTITIVPLVAQRVLDSIYHGMEIAHQHISTLDDHSILANWVEVALEASYDSVLRCLPGPLLFLLGELGDLFEQIPESVWNALPLTIISSVLGIVVVPWMIFKIDDFFQWLVRRKSESLKGRK